MANRSMAAKMARATSQRREDGHIEGTKYPHLAKTPKALLRQMAANADVSVKRLPSAMPKRESYFDMSKPSVKYTPTVNRQLGRSVVENAMRETI